VALLAGAMLLIAPGLVTDALGLGCLVAVLAAQRATAARRFPV
jgi:UPF0716 family protein affecting phage T7 exclusion